MTQQQYTPVAWQDETTSQQGTLINAERLNQMQTAHHFADGLEEVDTVPTADPGVAYHKIVYCTADNTLYRWDGEAWTADIDDPTRELLEEHEADHDNPHQVTKSQVGLGNADNTSDMDKPVSTATQTALNAKADKSDTYTKTQVDTALATKADKATTYTKTETDTLLGGKADKATTLAGYGITDAYTKTEADTLLGAKANDNAVVKLTGDQTVGGIKNFIDGINVPSTGKTSIWAGDSGTFTLNAAGGGYNRITCKNSNRTIDLTVDATVLRVPTAPDGASSLGAVNIAYLDGYAPMVRTTGNQTIAGVKTFTSSPIYYGEDGNGLILRKTNLPADRGTYTTGAYTEHNLVIMNGSGIAFAQLGMDEGNTFRRAKLRAYFPSYGWNALYLTGDSTGVYVTAPARTYDTTHTDDVVTIGTLKASTDVVHTSGAEAVAGVKTFSDILIKKSSGVDMSATPSAQQTVAQLDFQDKNGTAIVRFRTYHETNGNSELSVIVPQQGWNGAGDFQQPRMRFITGATSGKCSLTLSKADTTYYPSATEQLATIGVLDAYTPMVRTTGNQEIAGEKTFNSNFVKMRQGSTYFNAFLDTSHGTERYAVLLLENPNNDMQACLQFVNLPDGTCKLQFYRYNKSTGTAEIRDIVTI